MPDTIGTPSQARIVHRTRRRLRLRVPDQRGNHLWFARLQDAVGDIPAIEDALFNPRTASILLSFADGDADGVIQALSALDQLRLPVSATPSSQPNTTAGADAGNVGWPGPDELRTLVKLLVVGLLIRELWQGRWLVPAVVVLWLGGETLRRQLGLPVGR
jgi:hypothetical protein